MFLTHEKLTVYTEEIWSRRYEETVEVFPFVSRDAGCETDEVLSRYPGRLTGGELVRKGEFFIGRDRYLWLHICGISRIWKSLHVSTSQSFVRHDANRVIEFFHLTSNLF